MHGIVISISWFCRMIIPNIEIMSYFVCTAI
jgi:hypothetical protein